MHRFGLAWLTTIMLSVVLVGCGSSDDPVGVDGGNNNGADAGQNGGADAGNGEWEVLIQGDWTMGGVDEGYVCVRKTVTEDIYITAFEAINPLGTHHTVLTVGDPAGADGTSNCSAGTNHDVMIFGSGVGTNPLIMPEGVAMHVAAGQQLLLNLHLFNTDAAELAGTSGTKIKTIPASEVQATAEAILAGPTISLSVPPGVSTQSGGCIMNGDTTIFAIVPHMHQLGISMKVTAESSVAGDTVIHDGLYSFYEQKFYQIDPIQMKQGDLVAVDCEYNNTTGSTVSFGDSSTQEMCFATLYRYPSFGGDFGIICDRGF